jgi:hypothetical protein
MLRLYDAEDVNFYCVSPLVNNAGNELAEKL